MSKRAIIFDFDGVIVDTETPVYESWKTVFEKFGRDLSPEEYAPFIGSSDSSSLLKKSIQSFVAASINWEPIDKERRENYRNRIKKRPVQEGVVALIKSARHNGWIVGLATSSPLVWVDECLKGTGLRQADFSAISTKDDSGTSKPDPAVYQICLLKLGIPARYAVAIEDSNNGIRAARKAGLPVIVVKNGLTSSCNMEKGDIFLESLKDLSLDMVSGLMANPLIQRMQKPRR